MLSVGSTTLSLLVALIAVLTFASPKIAAMLFPPADNIQLQIIDCSPSGATVRLAISNTGERAGAIRRLRIEAPKGVTNINSPVPQKWAWRLDPVQPLAIVPAGEVAEYIAHSRYVLPEFISLPTPSATLQWQLVVEIIHASGEGEEIVLPFDASPTQYVGTPYPALIATNAQWYRYPPSDDLDDSSGWDDTVFAETLDEEETYIEVEVRPQFSSSVQLGMSPAIEIERIRIGSLEREEFHVLRVGNQFDPSPNSEYQTVPRVPLDSTVHISVDIPIHPDLARSDGSVPIIFEDLLGEQLGWTLAPKLSKR